MIIPNVAQPWRQTIDPSHKFHNASDKYPKMHHFVTVMWTHVHISVTKWCIMGYGTDALWGLWDWSICMPLGLCKETVKWSMTQKNLTGSSKTGSYIDMETSSCHWPFLLCWIYFRQHKNVFALSIISRHRDGTYSSWRRHVIETFSALLALCEGIPTGSGGFASQKTSHAELWCLKQTVGQTIELPMFTDAIALMWRVVVWNPSWQKTLVLHMQYAAALTIQGSKASTAMVLIQLYSVYSTRAHGSLNEITDLCHFPNTLLFRFVCRGIIF